MGKWKESEKGYILNHFALHLKQNVVNQLYFNKFFFFKGKEAGKGVRLGYWGNIKRSNE